jgi:hypothetical protein
MRLTSEEFSVPVSGSHIIWHVWEPKTIIQMMGAKVEMFHICVWMEVIFTPRSGSGTPRAGGEIWGYMGVSSEECSVPVSGSHIIWHVWEPKTITQMMGSTVGKSQFIPYMWVNGRHIYSQEWEWDSQGWGWNMGIYGYVGLGVPRLLHELSSSHNTTE